MRRVVAIGLAAIVLAGFAGLVGVRMIESRLETPYGAPDRQPVDVVVEPGTTAQGVAALLERAQVIAAARDLVWWLWWSEQTGELQAGEYRFEPPVSVREVARIITSGRVRLHPVTIPEGSNRWQVASAVAAAGFGEEAEVLESTARAALIADLDPEAVDLEGYLFPETYRVPAGTSADEIVELLVAAFRAAWTPERAARAEDLGMTLREVVILASLIEAEAQVADERALISAVFHNRLERGMLLQTDPTVLYARWLAGKDGRTIYMSDLQRDSPYNTYLHPGLPAGPICSPRAASIDAALAPAEVDYLYFVSRNDGTHAFSTTLREHNRYVDEYQR